MSQSRFWSFKRLAAIFSFLLYNLPFQAAAARSEDIEAEDIFGLAQQTVVTASKKAEPAYEAPGIISVVTAEDIRRFGARNLREILDRVTSIYTFGSFLYPDNIISIRGDFETHANNRVLFLINGRPCRESVYGGKDFAVILPMPIETIERIEIIRGPGSVLYGTKAFDGVINIISKTATTTQAQLQSGYGSFQTTKFAGSGGVKSKDLDLYGGVAHLKSVGWNFEAFDERRVKKSFNRAENNIGLNFSGKFKEVSLSGFMGDSRVEHMGGVAAIWPHDSETLRRGFVDAGYQHSFTNDWKAQANVTYNGVVDNLESAGTFLGRYAHDVLAELTISGKILDNFNIQFGGTVDRQAGRLRFENLSYMSTLASTYLEADYKVFDFLKFIAGGQYNKPQNLDADLVPRAGIIANFHSGWGAKLLYGEAYRSPFAVETSIRGLTVNGNPNLKPEKMATSDAQIFYNSVKVQASATYFQSNARDRIVRVPTSRAGVFTFDNVGELKSHGLELESKLLPLPSLSFMIAYSYLQNENEKGVEDITLMPNHLVKGGVSYDWKGGVTLGLFDAYSSQRSDVAIIAPNTLEVNPKADEYHWVTANIILDITKLMKLTQTHKISVRFYGENLLDQAVYDPEVLRQVINTLPARSGPSFMSEIVVNF